MGIEVLAYRTGFYGGERKRPGEKFTVKDDTIESGWFEPVDPSVKLKPRPELTPAQKAEAAKVARGKQKAAERARIAAERAGQGKKDEPVALSQLAKAQHKPTAREKAAVEAEDADSLA